MKKSYSFFFLFVLILMSCNSKKYLLEGNKKESQKLIEFIHQMKKQDKIKDKPVIVINEQVVKDKDLKKLKVNGANIQKIFLIEKGKSEMTDIYGDQAINGVIFLETLPSGMNASKSFEDSKVVIFLDGKEIDQSLLKSMNPNEIESITVIKDEKEVRKYTAKKCEGVILIISKKKT